MVARGIDDIESVVDRWRTAFERAFRRAEVDPARLHVGFRQGVALQFVNIKAWMLALTLAAGWVAGQADAPRRLAIIVGVMLVYAFTSNFTYALVGALLRRWLAIGRRLQVFNRTMALVLLGAALAVELRRPNPAVTPHSPAIREIATQLAMPVIRVLEVATFYVMFQLEPVGKVAFVQLCGTTPCQLRGALDLKAVLKAKIGPAHTVSADGKFIMVASRWAKKLTVIDIATRKVVRQVPVGKSPHGVWTLDHAPRH